jgi:hypothetical protein
VRGFGRYIISGCARLPKLLRSGSRRHAKRKDTYLNVKKVERLRA